MLMDWNEMHAMVTRLKKGQERDNAVAFPISNELAKNICSGENWTKDCLFETSVSLYFLEL